jgi:SAM-dependent methyltransferase
MKQQIKNLLGKLLAIRPFYRITSILFSLANKEIYKRSLTKSPVLKFSISQDWIRAPMYAAIYNFFERLSKKENLKNKIAIEIGGSEGSVKAILEEFAINYKVAPNFPEVDVQHLPYRDNSFDFLIVDQILEHVEKPWIAVEEIFRVLKPNGICIATGPFLIGYHPSPKDYFRYTPDGWKSLFSKFKILEAEGWGNGEIVKASLSSSVIGTPFGATIPVDNALEKNLLRKTMGKII